MSLKERLTKSRDSTPVAEYLQTIKTISDELALIDAPITDNDLVIHILNGIGTEFKEIAASIRTRETSISFEELHDKLIDYEAFLERVVTQIEPMVMTANITHRGDNSTHSNRRSNPTRGGYQGRPQFSQNRSNQGFNSNQCRRNGSFPGQGYRGFCQLCDQQHLSLFRSKIGVSNGSTILWGRESDQTSIPHIKAKEISRDSLCM
ncbi:hypothetical protein L1049_027113 [Liquidambar formosana]|uniref:Uncharacterized protein n=1 Tax=Liquidambar formosana TaxID=63359 RepID=A0AAP0N943_LIQFO